MRKFFQKLVSKLPIAGLIVLLLISTTFASGGYALLNSSGTAIEYSGGSMGLINGSPLTTANTSLPFSSESLLATVTSIDLKTTGQTTLLTVPGSGVGKVIITRIILRATSVSAPVSAPTVRVGLASAYTEWQTGMMSTAFGSSVVVDMFTDIGLITTSLGRKVFSTSDVVKLDITTGATATTLTATAYVYGYYLSS